MCLLRCVCFAAALCLCRLHHTGAGVAKLPSDNEARLSDQLEAIVDRLTTLDRRVEELQNQNRHLMNQLLQLSSNQGVIKVLQHLQAVCDEFRAVKSDPTTPPPLDGSTTDNSSVRECPQQPVSNQLQITAVMKEETDTVYKVTVCYVSPEKPEVTYTLSGSSDPQTTEHHDLGAVTLQRKKPESSESAHLGIEFTLKSEYYVYLSLTLNEDSPDEVRFPNLLVTVEPGHELVYDPGSDVDITFDIINEAGGERQQFTRNMTSLYLKSNTDRNTVDEFRYLSNIEMPEEISDIRFAETSHSKQHVSLLLHMPYSPNRTGGYAAFQLTNHFNCSHGCLVDMLQVAQRVYFYPEGRSGPFPENFVGFVKARYPEADNWDRIKCYEDNRVNNCLLRCVAVGFDPSVTLIRADQSPVSPHSDVVYDDSEYVAARFWEFENPRQEDAGEYVCQARPRAGSHVISKMITVSVGRVAEIVRQLTNVTIFPNGSLLAVCTAKGIPAPTIRFGPYYGTNSSTLLDEAVVTPDKLNNIMSQASLFLPHWRKFHRNDIDNIYCYAKNTEYIEDVQHMAVNETK